MTERLVPGDGNRVVHAVLLVQLLQLLCQRKDYYHAERVYGAFVRNLTLPAEINPEKVQALFKNGVLEIRLPKSEEAKKKAINVKVES